MCVRMTLIIGLVCLVCAVSTGAAQAIAKQGGAEMIDSGYVKVPNGELYYEKTGHGRPMVFLHDGLIHSEVWTHQIDYFKDHYTVVSYDRRGYGKSATPTESYSNVDDMLAVFDALGIDSAIVVGMSAGTQLALDFALEHPERVTHLILSGPAPSGMPFTDHFFTRGGHRPADLGSDPVRYFNYWIDEDPWEIYKDNKETKAEAHRILAPYPNNANQSIFTLAKQPRRPAVSNLGEIRVPTLVVVGEYDHPDIHAAAGVIAVGVEGAERVVINDAGHRLPMEQPQALIDAMESFLSSVEFFGNLRQIGPEKAIAIFKAGRQGTSAPVPFTEGRMNMLGYLYLQRGDIAGAVQLFKLNTESFPASANTFDSYAEALLASGDTTGSIRNYEKSLELNPGNGNAASMLERLRKQK